MVDSAHQPTESTEDEPPGPALVPAQRRRRFTVDTTPLRIKPFRRLWSSTVVTAIGSQLTAVAVPLQIYDDTGSSALVGVAGAVALVPLVVFALWGGAIADLRDRRTLLLFSNAGIAVTSLLFWAQAALGMHSVAVLFVLLAFQQALFGINAPTRTASVARLVPEAQLPAATALTSTVAQFGQILGPLLAGALAPVLGISTLYLVDTVALVITLWAVWKLPPLPPLKAAARRAGLKDVFDGFRYLWPRKLLLVSFVADIAAMVLGMPRALFPEMADTYFGGDAALGVLYAALPVGALLCGVFSGLYSHIRRHGVMVVLSVAAWGLAVAGLGLAHSLWLAALMLALAGAADMISMVFRGVILQSEATDEMRGRMQGVFTVVVAGGPRLADLLHGTVGEAVGARGATVGGGLLVVVAVVLLAFVVPAFWRYVPVAAKRE
ncbi:putative membrane transport protein [Streptomyces sp. Tu6071]|uniref:MFS transporter n=1 Tax=unclassified Streptomyces TaxID=2593676 RepID=UPI00020E5C00|nr:MULTISPECIES: MFS transporter [unclassified Streptomyces]ASY32314.1 MFS transporter [Streptomyces sp. CLI2509]EGJ74117.1 putative membrane transport protein [Streptomyces sp. Tu6071]MYX20172.1 MFS transporter [Streptomyces sp. SID8380]